MIPVAEALSRILAGFEPLSAETVDLPASLGRVLAEDVTARRTQPPVAMSAMDGYAVRAADLGEPPVTLTVVGEAPAGGAYDGVLGAGETVRIFTGGPVPSGADAVIMQEDTARDGDRVTMSLEVKAGKFIRPAGLDFHQGEVGLKAGHLISPRDIGLMASMNVPDPKVRRRPVVAVLATGDELVRPGEPMGPNQIVASNNLALAAMVEANGGEARDLGIALDTPRSLREHAAGAQGADMLVTIGGASVGDHDLIRSALGDSGLEIDFWRIAMRPGKPLIFGVFNGVPMLGLPGNPVSSQICGLIFMLPAMRRMLGLEPTVMARGKARLGAALPRNSKREAYLRASLTCGAKGETIATPFNLQDSSVQSRMARADCLIVQPPDSPPLEAGAEIEVIEFSAGQPLV